MNLRENTRAVWLLEQINPKLNFSFLLVFGGVEIMINWGQFLPERKREPGYEIYMSCPEGRMYCKNDTNILTISA